MQEKNINSLVINKVESQSVYDSMVAANKINDDELYLVARNNSQTSGVTGVKGAAETSYRTGDVNITAENIGALPADTVIPSKTSDLTNDSGFITSAPVTSVNSKTGAVTLAKGDVGLGNVDNTSDANKPISTATQTALNAKQATVTANGILKGDGSGNITAADEAEVELVEITADTVGAVPTTRTINGKALSSNITLTASDVNAASKSTTTTITLPASSWSGNITTGAVSGMTSSANIIVTPSPSSYIAYNEAGIRCMAQGSGALSFACEEVPTSDLQVNIIILG